MNREQFRDVATRALVRLTVAFACLLVAFGANADDCLTLYAKSGAVPGTRSCRLDVVSNTPGGMGNYACINDIALIDQWCTVPDAEKPEKSCPVADPVYPGSGAVTLTEGDFVSGDDIPMRFTRTYRSKPLAKNVSAMGPVWFHNWQRQLGLANANSGSSSSVLAYRENGEPVTFAWVGGQWRTSSFSGLALMQDGAGWSLTDLFTDITERYSTQGVLLSESTKTGFTRTLTYDSIGLLKTVSQHAVGTKAQFDLTLRLDYDDKRRLSRLNDPMSGITQYAYDANNNLVSVTWPDGNVRRYIYDDSRFRNAITGEIDETGTRVATWSYDALGRASAVSHPDASRNVRFSYGTGSTVVTDNQRATTLSFSPIGGMLRPTSSRSAAGSSTTSWAASGSLLSGTNATGGADEYTYDDAGRVIRLVVRNAASTTTTSVRYVDATGVRPAMIASPGKLRAFVYDAQGNLTGISVRKTTDPTGASGFDALWDGQQQQTVGLRYDASNRPAEAKVYVNGAKAADWFYFYDFSGNLSVAQDDVSRWMFGNSDRDEAHRVIWQTGDYREAKLVYDSRGRVAQFRYNEEAIARTSGLARSLTVNYGYAADGRVMSRTGTVSRNKGVAVPIGSDEIDRWLDNYERGADPVGPAAGSVGWVRSLLGASAEPGLVPVCVACAFNPALGWGWAVSSDNDDPFGIIGIAGAIRGGINQIANLCRTTPRNVSIVYEDKIIGQMKDRLWTEKDVETTIDHPYRTMPARDTRAIKNGNGARRDDPATAYIREDGHYVVRNDKDGTIVQISDRKNTNWKPGY